MKYITGLLIIAGLVGLFGKLIETVDASVHQTTFTITQLGNRSQQYNSDGSRNTYANLVYTNHGVYSNQDSTFPWKKNSSSVYAQLAVGKTYTCEVSGQRIGFFSWYQNIIKCNGFYQ